MSNLFERIKQELEKRTRPLPNPNFKYLFNKHYYAGYPDSVIAEYNSVPCFLSIIQNYTWNDFDEKQTPLETLSYPELDSLRQVNTNDDKWIWRKDTYYRVWTISDEQYLKELADYENYIDFAHNLMGKNSNRNRKTKEDLEFFNLSIDELQKGDYLGEYAFWQISDFPVLT